MAKVKDTKDTKETIITESQDTTSNVLENPEMVLGETKDFLDKNKSVIYAVLGGILVVIAGFVAYKYLSNTQQENALAELYPAEYYLEADSVNRMLNGDGNNLGAMQVADEYSWSKASKVAHLYAAIGLMKQSKYQEAVNHLDKFSSSDAIVQGKAYCLQGDAYLELNNMDKAISYYKKAIDHYPNKYFTPGYLMKLALAYELKKDYAQAVEVYDEILTKYHNSQDMNNAKKYKAKAEQMMSSEKK